MTRSGDEPQNARSALRLRLALALFGLVSAVVAVVVLARGGHPGVAAVFAFVGLLAVADAVVVAHRIRQGPHWQPGPDVPPYRPADPPQRVTGFRGPVPQRIRKREYLILMGTCIGLLLISWIWLRTVSTTLTVILTLVAMVIPPIAAIVANTRSPLDRRDR